MYGAYFKAVGILMTILAVGFQVIYQAFSILANTWLSTWSGDTSYALNNGTLQDEGKRDFYLEIYATYGLAQCEYPR